jgi:protein-S-isoprenylcysteine O-methyltransferase Ste14
MRVIDIIIAALWVVFWLGWFVAAATAKSGRIRWAHHAVVRVVIAVVVIVLLRRRVIHRPAMHNDALAVIGLVLFLLGLAIAVWARVHLGRNWGTPMSEKEDPELVTTGPYRWVRNPIYSGLILAMIGTAVAVNLTWLAVALPIGGYFVYSAVVEARYMAERFPDTYPAYRASTKMLLPYVF